MKDNNKSTKVTRIIRTISILLSIIIMFLSNYIYTNFTDYNFEQLLFSLFNSKGTSKSVITKGILTVLPQVLIMFIIYLLLSKIIKKIFKNTDFKIMRSYTHNIINIVITIFVLISSVLYSYNTLGVKEYVKNKNTYSDFFEENYVHPEIVSIKSNGKTNNLIYIYVESLETSMFSVENGGKFKESITPNLENLALQNTSFSNTSVLGGPYVTPYTNWTIAGMVATTSGIPFKVSPTLTNENTKKNFVEGAYSLGQILEKNNYKNYLLLGSNGDFAGRKTYFEKHGNYQVHDYYYAVKKGWIPANYYTWWGYEDKKLFEFAKKELLELKNNNQKFNYTLLTADTHFQDGYVDEICKKPYQTQYLNSYNCTDYLINEFITWLKTNDFLKDTTIVITGDHTTMQSNINNMFEDNTYERRLTNIYINPKVEPINQKNRITTTFDLYPTTVASLGFEIEGNRLGLGTNLFSNKKALTESKYALDEFINELGLNSEYYNEVITKSKNYE